MNRTEKQQLRRDRRLKRVRSKLHGTAARPRVSVYRSNQHIYAQAINDDAQMTVAAANDVKLEIKGTKTERAQAVAKALADALKAAKVKAVVFDRGAYRYHGRVQAVAETLRAEGIEV